mmetsp:Transcript_7025/g.24387  ORF Transcript_7025/g.24387 Transcript_7025/m.24387 type:complete len:218 (-) Transcript_7025:387-1040(-)
MTQLRSRPGRTTSFPGPAPGSGGGGLPPPRSSRPGGGAGGGATLMAARTPAGTASTQSSENALASSAWRFLRSDTRRTSLKNTTSSCVTELGYMFASAAIPPEPPCTMRSRAFSRMRQRRARRRLSGTSSASSIPRMSSSAALTTSLASHSGTPVPPPVEATRRSSLRSAGLGVRASSSSSCSAVGSILVTPSTTASRKHTRREWAPSWSGVAVASM